MTRTGKGDASPAEVTMAHRLVQVSPLFVSPVLEVERRPLPNDEAAACAVVKRPSLRPGTAGA